MIRVGITGQSGFIGMHLYNTLGLEPEKFERIPFKDDFFSNPIKLEEFVGHCDAIVHLAAMNRHNNPQVIYDTNLWLIKQLIKACENTGSAPHLLFSSSTQEERDNLYGKSKRDGRILFENWTLENNGRFTGLVIPNVFGPFGLPYYNSVVATFCHQLTHNETPKIEMDGEMKLIYVGELVNEIIKSIIKKHYETQTKPIQGNCTDKMNKDQQNLCQPLSTETIYVPHTSQLKVSSLLQKLQEYKTKYFEKGIIPCLEKPFDRDLFNTFLSYINLSTFFPFHLKQFTDDRGSFVETVKLHSGGQVSFSTTNPGITRGNHFHTRKAERFAVIKGKAHINIRRIGTEKVLSFELDGSRPSFVDMPVWYTHNITNSGNEDLYTIFWINEHYNPEDGDTYFEKV